MRKGMKYNLIIIVLIIMMGVFLGAYGASFSSFQIEQVQQNQQENNETVEEMPTGKFTPPSSTAKEFTRLAFAFKVLKEGDGFYSETMREVISMGQSQFVFTRSYRAKEQEAMEEWRYSNISMAKNDFVVYYNNLTTVNQKIINDKSKYTTSPFEYQASFAGNQQTFQTKDFENNYGNFNNFPITINSQTSTITAYDKRSDKNNYIITVSINPSKIDKTYVNFFQFNGSDNVIFSQVSVTFKINKTTGFFTEITKTEHFKTAYAGMSVSCQATSVQVFKKVNISQKNEVLQIANKNS